MKSSKLFVVVLPLALFMVGYIGLQMAEQPTQPQALVVQPATANSNNNQLICGVSFEAPPRPINQNSLEPIVEVNANWVAVIPYAFSRAGQPSVNFNYSRQWWGEREEGARATITYAHNLGLKVMLKPQVWIGGQGWPGEYKLTTESQWQQWEKDYAAYLLSYAKVAHETNAEMLCIGTEYRLAVRQRPQFWPALIQQIKEVYKGKLTYAANWDNIENVTFWDRLDYIGIDAYFPLCESKTPTVAELQANWAPHLKQIEALYQKNNKPVLFTEYGYRSIDYAAGGHWNVEGKAVQTNHQAQCNAYTALFTTLLKQKWYRGGFLWKWHANHQNAGGNNNNRFTPQNKPAQDIIKNYYARQ